MDRRQRKTREAILHAFTELLAKKEFSKITVGEIIDHADVGRATFYAHFETKDFLMKALCEELFCHIFDAMQSDHHSHKHIFACDAPNSVFLHLFQHLQKNDHRILDLLESQNNELFARYFKLKLQELVISQLPLFELKRNENIPQDFWIHHISSVFVETVRWWIANGRKESPETMTAYFYTVV